MDKDVRKFVQSISGIDGVEVRQGTKHLRVWKDGQAITTIPLTPSDHRWKANATAELRRAGVTPAARVNGKTAAEYRDLIPMTEIKLRLAAMPNKTRFGEFLFRDVASTTGLRGFKSEKSAVVTVQRLSNRGRSEVQAWTHELLDAGLRMWDKIESQKARELVTDRPEIGYVGSPPGQAFMETFENVALVETETLGVSAITLRVDAANSWRWPLDSASPL